MNEIELTSDDLAKKEYKPLSIDLFRQMADGLEFDVPYQRGDDVWTPKMKQHLIESILEEIPIGSFHLVQQTTGKKLIKIIDGESIAIDNSNIYSVLDGKQRGQCILDFINNKFSIELNGKKMTFKDIKKSPLITNFLNYQLHIMWWKPMHILKARALFERINAMCNLNKNEQLYCPNFFAKSLMTYIWNDCFGTDKYNPLDKKESYIGLRKHLRSEIGDDKRYSGIRWCHNVCYVCFGPNLNDVFAFRDTRIDSSVKTIDNSILDKLGRDNLKDDDKCFITPELLEELGIAKNIELLKSTCKHLTTILDNTNNLPKKIEANIMKDLISFLVEKQQKKELTESQLKDNKEKINFVIDQYIDQLQNSVLKSHQTNPQTIESRFKLLESLFLETMDLQVKNKPLSETDKTLARLRSDGKCENCGCLLTKDNIRDDHVLSKAKYGSTPMGLLCEACNHAKSDLTKNNCKDFIDYIEKKEKVEANN